MIIDKTKSPAQIIYAIRHHLDLTQREFAKLVNIKNGVTISLYEVGIRTPGVKTACRIIDVAKGHDIEITLEMLLKK